MKYVEAKKVVDAFVSDAVGVSEVDSRGAVLILLCEIFGCLDQISIHTRDLAKIQKELAETYAQMLELHQKRQNGK